MFRSRYLVTLAILLFFIAIAIISANIVYAPKPLQQKIVAKPTTVITKETVPSFSHVFLIVLENHNFQEIIGNPAAPYINGLAHTYAYAANFSAISHPSLPNYLALVAGNTFGITNDCNDCFLNNVSIFQQIEQQGKTWKAYLEGMPANCYLSDFGNYPLHHNPAAYFLQIRKSCEKFDVPFAQFSSDIQQRNQLANFVWISPDDTDNMHSGSITRADTWLKKIIPQILQSPTFKENSVLFITWDESSNGYADNRIPTLVISPLAKSGYVSEKSYTLYSLLKTIEDGLGLVPLGNAGSATAMSDFFYSNK